MEGIEPPLVAPKAIKVIVSEKVHFDNRATTTLHPAYIILRKVVKNATFCKLFILLKTPTPNVPLGNIRHFGFNWYANPLVKRMGKYYCFF